MLKDKDLKNIRHELLEERVITYLARTRKLDTLEAMDIYYSSRLADQVARNEYGLHHFGYRELARMLMEKDPELFSERGKQHGRG